MPNYANELCQQTNPMELVYWMMSLYVY